MKTKLLLSAFLSFYFCLLSSQVPQGFNYQAIARDGSNPITTPIDVRITIQSGPTSGPLFVEEHSAVTPDESGLFNLVIGDGVWKSGVVFSAIDWSVTPKYIKTEINYGGWKTMGAAALWSVPYSMVAKDLKGSVNKLGVKGTTTDLTEALFEVKNYNNQTVFAVYGDGVRAYVDNISKGAKGGFAIGGFGKGQDYLIVDPGNIKMYIDDQGKGAKGGFAIGGYGKGGNFFNVDAADVATVSENRVLWYPLKNAFLAGNVLITDPLNVGENSFATGFQSKAKGNYSQSLGYKTSALGAYSTAIGKNAIANSDNSFAFGDGAQATDIDSYAFGAGAIASGQGSFAFGSFGRDTATFIPNTQPTEASGDYAFAIGLGAKSSGNSSTALGIMAYASGNASLALGVTSKAEGDKALALNAGYATGRFSFASGLMTKAQGDYSVAIGRGITKFGGVYNLAAGYGSMALGYSRVYGYNSIGIGTADVGTSVLDCNYGVGIGNSVTVNGEYAIAIGRTITASSYASFVIGNNNIISGSTTAWVPDDPLFVIGNGTTTPSNAMTVLKNGNVGIGIYAPSYPLHIVRLNPGYVATFANGGYTTDSHGILIYAGTTSTGGAKLISFTRPNKSSGYEIGSITQVDGSSVAYNTTSDARIKTNIADTRFNITDLMQVKVRDFEFRDDPGGGTKTGFIAQELFEIYPNAVTEPLDSKHLWQIDYGKVTPLIVKAVQDQQSVIESLSKENQRLRSDLQELRKEIAQIKELMIGITLNGIPE